MLELRSVMTLVTHTTIGGREVPPSAQGCSFKGIQLLTLLRLRKLAKLAVLVNCSLLHRGKASQHEGSGFKEEHDGLRVCQAVSAKAPRRTSASLKKGAR